MAKNKFPKEFLEQIASITNKRAKIVIEHMVQYAEAYSKTVIYKIDHRIPYQIVGDVHSERKTDDYMLLCVSCNRAKSWSCEHCSNWKEEKASEICISCYWGTPESYCHIAGKEMRRMDLQWSWEEIKHYDAIKLVAEKNNVELPEFVKEIIAQKSDCEKLKVNKLWIRK